MGAKDECSGVACCSSDMGCSSWLSAGSCSVDGDTIGRVCSSQSGELGTGSNQQQTVKQSERHSLHQLCWFPPPLLPIASPCVTSNTHRAYFGSSVLRRATLDTWLMTNSAWTRESESEELSKPLTLRNRLPHPPCLPVHLSPPSDLARCELLLLDSVDGGDGLAQSGHDDGQRAGLARQRVVVEHAHEARWHSQNVGRRRRRLQVQIADELEEVGAVRVPSEQEAKRTSQSAGRGASKQRAQKVDRLQPVSLASCDGIASAPALTHLILMLLSTSACMAGPNSPMSALFCCA